MIHLTHLSVGLRVESVELAVVVKEVVFGEFVAGSELILAGPR